ncbi:MAG: response regulator transcription factor [Ignavibacteria bacterium]|nr:response regulator transcription factor [Ignavibacteria bacterium]
MPDRIVNVVIVDDHRLLREGLKSLLSEVTGITVIGEAPDGEQGLEVISSLQPDVVLMDISLPGIFGYEVVSRIKAESPAVKFLMITNFDNDMYFYKCVHAGAGGVIHKNPTRDELKNAILQVFEGTDLFYNNKSPKEIETVLRRYDQEPAYAINVEEVRLTPREKEILKRVLMGRSYKEIAAELFISVKTVENHRRVLLTKFNAKSAYELMSIFTVNEKLRRKVYE